MGVTNCPNCGAPVESNQCEYCGTYIFDFSQIELYKPCWISVDLGDGVKRLVHARLREASLCSGVSDVYYADNCVACYFASMPELSMTFDVFPDDKRNAIMISKKEN